MHSFKMQRKASPTIYKLTLIFTVAVHARRKRIVASVTVFAFDPAHL